VGDIVKPASSLRFSKTCCDNIQVSKNKAGGSVVAARADDISNKSLKI
jgi:hypothetical protein